MNEWYKNIADEENKVPIIYKEIYVPIFYP